MNQMLTATHRWYMEELARLYRADPVPRGILLACPVWGPVYVQKLARWCLPSILAGRGSQLLADGGARLALCVDLGGFLTLHPLLRDIERTGIKVSAIIIPEPVLQEAHQKINGQFELLGLAQALCVQDAQRCGAGLHVLHPDHVRSINYFERLATLAEKHDVILQTTISALNSDVFAGRLEQYRGTGGVLEVPVDTLYQLAWMYLHPASHSFLLNGTLTDKGHADVAGVMWRGPAGAEIASATMDIAWMSREACAALPLVPPSTLDAELPKLVPRSFYVPGAQDGLGVIEISEPSKKAAPPTSAGGYLKRWWQQMHFNDAGLCFAAARSIVPLPPMPGVMTADEVDTQHRRLLDQIRNAKVAAMEESLQGLAQYPMATAGLAPMRPDIQAPLLAEAAE